MSSRGCQHCGQARPPWRKDPLCEDCRYARQQADARAEEARNRARDEYASALPVRRRRVLAQLRALGYRRAYASRSGSLYYRRGEDVVRVSDHAVPMTDERLRDPASWAHGGRWEIRLDESEARIQAALDNIAEEVSGE